MKLAELLQPWVTEPLPSCEIIGLQNDSRRVQKGDLFFACGGNVVDGRLFMSQAAEAGAAAIVYEKLGFDPSFKLPTTIPSFAIAELSRQLGEIASHFYHHPSQTMTITGVTGTNGKTTIAYQLAQAYELLGTKAAYIGTLGQGKVGELQTLTNTTPDAFCLQQLFHHYQQIEIQQVCMEVSSHALAQHRVGGINFSQAIYTNLSLDHLDYHLTMDNYASAKAQLFAHPALDWAIINQDDSYSALMAGHVRDKSRIITYGIEKACNVRAVRWRVGMMGSEMDIVSPWGEHRLQVALLGKFNVYNTLAVYTSLLAAGFDLEHVLSVIGQLKASPGRMEVVAKEPCVIVDFAHTPDALEKVLLTLNQLKQKRLIVVFGCGGDRDKTKRPIMGKIASQYADAVIVTSDNPRTEDPSTIVEEVAAGMLPSTEGLKIIDREAAIRKALEIADKLDIILIAGKGHEAYQQIGIERFSFSDQEVVRRLLATPNLA